MELLQVNTVKPGFKRVQDSRKMYLIKSSILFLVIFRKSFNSALIRIITMDFNNEFIHRQLNLQKQFFKDSLKTKNFSCRILKYPVSIDFPIFMRIFVKMVWEFSYILHTKLEESYIEVSIVVRL